MFCTVYRSVLEFQLKCSGVLKKKKTRTKPKTVVKKTEVFIELWANVLLHPHCLL